MSTSKIVYQIIDNWKKMEFKILPVQVNCLSRVHATAILAYFLRSNIFSLVFYIM